MKEIYPPLRRFGLYGVAILEYDSMADMGAGNVRNQTDLKVASSSLFHLRQWAKADAEKHGFEGEETDEGGNYFFHGNNEKIRAYCFNELDDVDLVVVEDSCLREPSPSEAISQE